MIPSVYEADSSSFKSSLSNWKSHLTSCSVLTASFYFFQMMAQRCYGRLGLHSGLSNTILTPVGCISTISTLLLSQNVETYIRNNPNQFGLQSFYTTRPPPSSLPSSSFPSFSFFSFGSTKAAVPVVRSPREERRYQLKRLVLGLSSFVALEQSAFRSVFPSSIISLGVFSNLSKRFRRSVATESALTTQSQRAAIQKLGKRFGCHHCGSRQFVFNRSKVFIADHMPPTKIAEALSRKWWRRLFGWTVIDLVALALLWFFLFMLFLFSPGMLGATKVMASML